MPVYLDPKRTFDYVLPADKDKENPTTFEITVFTAREHRQIIEMFDEKTANFDAALKIVKAGLAGWRNFGDVLFDVNNIDLYLTTGEIQSIAATIMAQASIDEVMKKKSELPSASSTA